MKVRRPQSNHEYIMAFRNKRSELDGWQQTIQALLSTDPILSRRTRVLQVKGRVKTEKSLVDKINRKYDPDNRCITPDNLFREIEDLAGVRIVLSSKIDVPICVQRIRHLEKQGSWRILGQAHYVWHPDEAEGVETDGDVPERRSDCYSSRHFILANRTLPEEEQYALRCEVQIRTILEEALFENYHRICYKRRANSYQRKLLKRLAELIQISDQLVVDAQLIK